MESRIDFLKENIIQAVRKLSNDKLQQQSDLEYLIDAGISKNKINVLEELSFNAKYFYSLLKIIQRKNEIKDDSYIKKITIEFDNSAVKIKNEIEELLEGNEFILNVFSDKYFRLTHQSFANLGSLCSDLNYLKFHFNDLKTDADGLK